MPVADDEPTVVHTTTGAVRGRSNGLVRSWRGIPYAASTAGAGRFRAPQPPASWAGVRDCTRFGDAAPQARRFLAVGVSPRGIRYQPASENCLSLNVWAPANVDSPRPVLLFIHGGANVMGTSATPLYDGADLARQGIVVVTINYRLGTLGYLDLSQFSNPDRPMEANLGLRDQIAALRWVAANIGAFGGDPGQVTIAGESAGATAVATLFATPSAAGLFHAGIIESPAMGMLLHADHATRMGSRFAEIVVSENGISRDPATALTQASTRSLLKAGERLAVEYARMAPGLYPYGPVVDGDLLPVNPIDSAAAGGLHRLPLIIGTNRDEATLFTKLWDILPTTRSRIDRMFAATDDVAGQRILSAYPDLKDRSEVVRFAGDTTFWVDAMTYAEAAGEHQPTYVYRYDFTPKTLRWTGFGATHGSELLAVFGTYRTIIGRALALAGDLRRAARVTDEVQQRWAAFIGGNRPGDDWPRYNSDTPAVLVMDSATHVEFDPRATVRAAWRGYTGYRAGVPVRKP